MANFLNKCLFSSRSNLLAGDVKYREQLQLLVDDGCNLQVYFICYYFQNKQSLIKTKKGAFF
jgi:hypothetical protein